MNTVEYYIEDIDYFECDAFLVINGVRIYFQFSNNEVTLESALNFIRLEVQTSGRRK